MINLRKQMGERIKKRRKQLYLTQDKLAEQAGVTIQTISSAEHGTKGLRPESLLKICSVLEITPNDLYLGESSLSEMNLVIESTEHMELEELRRLENYVQHQIAIREAKDLLLGEKTDV